MADHSVIYLAPECDDCGEGRSWAEDCPWDACECDGSPHKPVKYVLAPALMADHARLVARLRATGGGGQGGPLKAAAADAIESLLRERDGGIAVCDAYALENQQFHDRFTTAEAQLARLRPVIDLAREYCRVPFARHEARQAGKG